MSETPESRTLRQQLQELRELSAVLKKDITPEWLASLPEEERDIIDAELRLLQRSARDLMARIQEHYPKEEEE